MIEQAVPKDRTLRREASYAAICGAILAVFFVLLTPAEWLAEEPLIGAHLARSHGFLTAYTDRADAIPTAASPPLYPFVVAGVYKVLGIESKVSVAALYGINVISVALIAAGIYVLTYRFFGKLAARWSIVILIIYPELGRTVSAIWDTLPSLAAFIWIVIWCRQMQKAHSATVWRIFKLGIALGLLTLAHVTAVLTYPFLITMALGKRTIGSWFKMSSIAFVTFLLVLTPWTIRNYQVFGRIFAVRNNFPMEIWLGNQPGSYGNANMKGHPANDPVEREKVLALGENPYFDELWKKFLQHYHDDPAAYWKRTLNRLGFLFVDSMEGHRLRAARIFVEVMIGLIGLAGVLMAHSLKYRCTWFFWLCLLSVLPYLTTQVAIFYALPLRVALIVYSGFFAAAVTSRLTQGKLPKPPVNSHVRWANLTST